jgi:HEAT repeat protein
VDQYRALDYSVVEAAGRLGESGLAELFQEILNRSKEPSVRVAAAFGLAKLGDETGVALLVEHVTLLKGAPKPDSIQEDSEGKTYATNNPAFSEWGEGKPPIHALIQAVRYVGELRAVQAFPLLLELTSIQYEWPLREVIKSLVLYSDKRAVPALVKLTHPDHPLRYEAARALLFFDDPEAEQAVRRLYPQEQDRIKLSSQAKELGPAEFLRH